MVTGIFPLYKTHCFLGKLSLEMIYIIFLRCMFLASTLVNLFSGVPMQQLS